MRTEWIKVTLIDRHGWRKVIKLAKPRYATALDQAIFIPTANGDRLFMRRGKTRTYRENP